MSYLQINDNDQIKSEKLILNQYGQPVGEIYSSSQNAEQDFEDTQTDALEVINQIENSQTQIDIFPGYSFEELEKLNLELEKELGLTMPPVVKGKPVRILTEIIPYWKSLYRILKEAYLIKILKKQDVYPIIEAFAEVPDAQKPKQIDEIEKILNTETEVAEYLRSYIIKEQIREEILDSISDYPLEYQTEFINYFIKGEIPPQDFYDRLKKQMEVKNIAYKDPYTILENIKKNSLNNVPRFNQAYTPEQIQQLVGQEEEEDEFETLDQQNYTPQRFQYSDEVETQRNTNLELEFANFKKKAQFQKPVDLQLYNQNLPKNIQPNNPYPNPQRPAQRVQNSPYRPSVAQQKQSLLQTLVKNRPSGQPNQPNHHQNKGLDDLLK